MRTGRITFGPKQQESELSKTLDKIRNLGGGLTLASHGFTPRCRVCERHTHAKWHECAKGEVNPVALLGLLETLDDGGSGAIEAVRSWVSIVAGIDDAAMRAMLESERAAGAVDPHAGSTGTPTTRVWPVSSLRS